MDDLISRQAAIDALIRNQEIYSDNSDPLDRYAVAIIDDDAQTIAQLPSAQPERQWIPCSERLPKNGRQVLVYATSVHFALAKYDEMREEDGSYKKQWVTFDAWKPYYAVKDVIAWMEVPEPYGEEQDEQKN